MVVFDNLNLMARMDLSLKTPSESKFIPAPSLGLGFEDIAIDNRNKHYFCLIEALEDVDGLFRSFVAEYDRGCQFVRCTPLSTQFEKSNKGFEGLVHVWLNDQEFLYALWEGKSTTSKKHAGACIDAFVRATDGGWNDSHRIHLPELAEFEDFSALAYRDERVAIVSQASARLWVAR